MKKILFRIISTALFPFVLLLIAGVRPTSAQEGLQIVVEAGLDGHCKSGAWFPVNVTIESNGPDLEGELYVKAAENLTEWFFSEEISIPSVSRKAYTIYVYPPAGRLADIEVGLIAGGELIYVEGISVNCLAETEVLLGVWAQNPSLFNPQTDISAGAFRSVLLVLDEHSLPDRAEGLEMLTSLTISNVDSSKLTDSQRTAISDWVAQGGKLLVTGGPGWQETTAGWDELLPFTPSGTATAANLNPLLNLVPLGSPLDSQAVVTTGTVRENAVVVSGTPEMSLIVRRQVGFGEVVFITPDPSLEPLRTWTGIGTLYDFLLNASNETPPWIRGFSDWNSATNALNAIEGLGMPPFILVCGFVTLYIALVGPINFIILRRRKKHESAWISVPVLVVVFTGIILFISTNLLGSRPVLNRLTVIQAWPGVDRATVHSLVGVFSPKRETFAVEMGDDFIASPIPPYSFRADGWNHRIYQETSGFRAPEIRVDLGGLQGLVVSGQVPAPAYEADFRIEITDTSPPTLTGTFTNLSEVTLRDVILLSSTRPVTLGDVSPGEAIPVSTGFVGNQASSSGTLQSFGVPQFGMADTLTDLFGTNYLYQSSSTSVENFRRFNLISAALGGQYISRGGGTFLVGWTDEAPFDTLLTGREPKTTDTTAYIFQVQPKFVYAVNDGSLLTLPPGMFSWSVFETPSGIVTASPYDGYLSDGEYALRFLPKTAVQFSDVETLVLHMESYGAGGPANLEAQLWDFREGAWSLLPPLLWGDSTIAAPERFVGADGEIRIKIKNPAQFSISIEQIDFTLTLRR